jgi:sulfur carrier protein ThiS
MKVTVKWFSAFRVPPQMDNLAVDLPEEATVADILDFLREGVGNTTAAVGATVFLVNERRATPETPLKDGDQVAILQILGGG